MTTNTQQATNPFMMGKNDVKEVKVEFKIEKEQSSTLSLGEISSRNNIPEKKCHSFGEKSDEKNESFKSESLSPSPKNEKIKEE